MIRLRYARVLYEETDNDLEAETALSKGVSEHASRISDERLNVKQIDLCERVRGLLKLIAIDLTRVLESIDRPQVQPAAAPRSSLVQIKSKSCNEILGRHD